MSRNNTIAQQQNPFQVSAKQQQITFSTTMVAAMQAELFFDDIALSVSCHEVSEAANVWGVEVLVDQAIDVSDIERRLELFAEHFSLPIPTYQIGNVTADLWQNNLQQFPPIRIHNWFIHGSHIHEKPKVSSHNLCIDAGLAFGSGEHATTEGCLTLLKQHMKKNARPNKAKTIRVLDMGCGSAILAMGAATLSRQCQILGVEIDHVAAKVAHKNVRLNQLQRQIHIIAADGYASKTVKHSAPYDIILANILARPLMKMAKNLDASLGFGGVAILSGLLNSQERMVIAAHQLHGLKVKHIWRKAGWSAIIMHKPDEGK